MKKTLAMTLAPWLIMLLVACSTTPEKPAWLDGKASNYPAARYLSASGEGDKRSTADNRALANLARIFEVSISDKTMDFSSATVTQTTHAKGNRQRTIDNKQEVTRFINTEARQSLSGARIVERWQDSKTQQYYSLAVLEKAPAIARFMKAIRGADREAEAAVTYVKYQAPNAVAALGTLEKARQRQIKRANDNSNLRVLTGTGIDAKYTAGDIEGIIRSALAQLAFTTTTTDAAALSMLQAAAAKVGMKMNKNSHYGLDLTIDQSEPEKQQRWYWLRGSVQLAINENGKTIATRRWPFKVSSQNPEMLNQRLRDYLSKTLPDYVYELLTPQM